MNIFDLVSSILIGGCATVTATQILKSKYIPVPAQKYPCETAAVVALVSAVIAVWQSGISVNVHDAASLVAVFVGTLWVAVSVYNNLKPVTPLQPVPAPAK